MWAALLLALTLATSDRPKLPRYFPVKIGPFTFGDTADVVKTKCERLGRKLRDGKPRFEEGDEAATCRAVWTGLPYLPGAANLRLIMRDNKLATIGQHLDRELLADYVRQIREQTGREGPLTNGMICAQFTDGLGLMCVDMTNSTLFFTASF
jgi:hypothetical protein